jgi:hypothetical protein
VEVTFPLAHFWQSLQKLVMSAPMPLHTKREEIRRLVALMPGRAMEWMLKKTAFLKLTGTTGLGRASETSHIKFFLPKGKNSILSDVEAAASCISAHSSLAAAIRER